MLNTVVMKSHVHYSFKRFSRLVIIEDLTSPHLMNTEIFKQYSFLTLMP